MGLWDRGVRTRAKNIILEGGGFCFSLGDGSYLMRSARNLSLYTPAETLGAQFASCQTPKCHAQVASAQMEAKRIGAIKGGVGMRRLTIRIVCDIWAPIGT